MRMPRLLITGCCLALVVGFAPVRAQEGARLMPLAQRSLLLDITTAGDQLVAVGRQV